MEKTTRRFRDISATLAELNAEGLHAQTVTGLFTMDVGAASHHVLRMSFCPGGSCQEDSTLRSLGSGRNSSSATLIPSSTCHSSLAAWALALMNNAMQLPPGELGKESSPLS